MIRITDAELNAWEMGVYAAYRNAVPYLRPLTPEQRAYAYQAARALQRAHSAPVFSEAVKQMCQAVLAEARRGQITWRAAWNPEEGEVTVTRDVYAGVSGPAGTYPATSREQAITALFKAGFLVGDDWEVTRYGAHWVSLSPMA